MIEGKDYATKGDWKNASKHLKIASDLKANPTTAILYYDTLVKQRLEKEATEFVEKWLERHPEDQVVGMYVASQALKKKDPRAIQLYRSLLTKSPENVIILNNLASALANDGQLADAIAYAKRAYQLNPDVASVIDTYGYLILQNKQYAQAQVLLKQAYEALPGDPGVAYHYALSLKENQQEQRAKAILELALKKNFKEKAQAEALLQSLL